MSEKKDIEEQVDIFLEGVLFGCFTVAGEKFEDLLVEVLNKIWTTEIQDKKNEIQAIIFADGSSLFPIEQQEIKKWVLFFPETLCEQSDEVVRYVIAHEFSHWQLGHDEAAGKRKYDRGERAADELATRWGFPEPKSIAGVGRK